MTDKLIEALERIASGINADPVSVNTAREALAAHRSQQDSASPNAKGAKAATWGYYDGKGWITTNDPQMASAMIQASGLDVRLLISPAPSESEARAWLYPIGGGRFAATTDESAARSASTDGSYHALGVIGAALSASGKQGGA